MSAKFNLLCDLIGLIEKRYDGNRSRLNLQGFCDRLHQKKNKFVEMVDKSPVEVILYLMAVLVKLIDDIESGKNKTYNRPGPTPRDSQKAKIVDMIMDRMIEEEREEQERVQRIMQAQISYAQAIASNLPQMLNQQPFPTTNNTNSPFQQSPFQGFATTTTQSSTYNPLSPPPNAHFLPKPISQIPPRKKTKRKPGRPKGSKNKPKNAKISKKH